MQTWIQNYDPLGNLALSALVALIPIAFFFLALTVLKMKGNTAALITVCIAFVIALFVYRMPLVKVVASTGYGIAYGIWPISWIVICSVLLYKLSVKTGSFELIRSSIISISNDQRMQLLLIGYSFNAFLEGAAGFGAPIAISASLLTGLGFNPLLAAALCLIANSASGAFGALGIPVIVAGQVSQIDKLTLSQMLGIQLPIISFLVPFLLIFIMDGVKGIRETFPALVVSGGTYAISQFLVIYFLGPELANIISSLVSLGALAFFLRSWHPKRIFRYEEAAASTREEHKITVGDTIKGWAPFYILTIIVFVWSSKWFQGLFAKGGPLEYFLYNIPVPSLDKLVLKSPPVSNAITPYAAVFKFDLLSATGTAILVSVILTMVLFRVRLRTGIALLQETLVEFWRPLITICLVLAFAYIANYSGLSSTLGLALSKTGRLFPFFSPVLGWIGVFLTGSVVSNNALFGNLQVVTGQQIGISPVLLVAANTSGGVMAKMLSPQSIAIAAAAVGLIGQESKLFSFTVKYSFAFLLVVAVMTYGLAFVIPGFIP
ncbi:lactate permease LctP family transporter [Brevibacillus ginsengisoli]|uniref:lactate permease LctP family transporter n=1 Tax=Brevibacillus ginsengisoli TaxID=363854 RepID=UPI003CF6133F